MLSLCFAVPNEDTNLTAVDLSSSIYAPLAGCDFRTGHDVGAEFWENRSAGDWHRRGAEKDRLRVLRVRDDVLQGALLIVLVFLRLVDHK